MHYATQSRPGNGHGSAEPWSGQGMSWQSLVRIDGGHYCSRLQEEAEAQAQLRHRRQRLFVQHVCKAVSRAFSPIHNQRTLHDGDSSDIDRRWVRGGVKAPALSCTLDRRIAVLLHLPFVSARTPKRQKTIDHRHLKESTQTEASRWISPDFSEALVVMVAAAAASDLLPTCAYSGLDPHIRHCHLIPT